jgi:hypothetical protein
MRVGLASTVALLLLMPEIPNPIPTPEADRITPDTTIGSPTPFLSQESNFTLHGRAGSGYIQPYFGDTLVIVVALGGNNTVFNVKDGPGDNFTQIFYKLQVTGGGHSHGLAIWLGYTNFSGPSTLSVVLSKGSVYSAAIQILDLQFGNLFGGLSYPPLDRVGMGPATESGIGNHASSVMPATPADLVITAVASQGSVNWAPDTTGGTTAVEIDQTRTKASAPADNTTLMSMYNITQIVRGVGDNASSSASVPWISESLTFTGPGPPTYPTTQYSVTFTEDGLPADSEWAISLSGITKSSTGSVISLSAVNYTYSWNVSTLSLGFIACPAGGQVTVSGAGVTVHVTFTSSGRCPPNHSVQYTWSPLFDDSVVENLLAYAWDPAGYEIGIAFTYYGENGSIFFHTYALKSGQWVELPVATPFLLNVLTLSGPLDPLLYGVSLVYDTSDGYMLLVSSLSWESGSSTIQTWKLQGGAWIQIPGKNAPPSLGNLPPQVLYDASDGMAIVYGGNYCYPTCGEFDTEIWGFHAGVWHRLANPPVSARGGYIIYDPNLRQVVMFGRQVWTFHASRWARISPASYPGPYSGSPSSGYFSVPLSLDYAFYDPALHGAITAGTTNIYHIEIWKDGTNRFSDITAATTNWGFDCLDTPSYDLALHTVICWGMNVVYGVPLWNFGLWEFTTLDTS